MGYKAQVEKTIPLSRKRTFAALMDFGAIARQAPDFIATCRVEGSGVGAVRTFTLQGGTEELAERLDCAYDERVFAYTLVTPSSMQLDYYHAVVILEDAPGGGCHLTWGSNWISRVTPDAEVVVMLKGLYDTLIDAMVKDNGA